MTANTYHRQLLDRITSRKANIGVIGLGYVGLPLAVECARQGFNVSGFDVDESKTALINAGKSYIPDVPDKELAEVVKAGRLRGTSRMGELADMDVIDICVPTPLRKTKDPDLCCRLAEAVAATLKRGPDHLESTTYPGHGES
jgi:UDP-N-acetyl-D-glucosamine dehydrogenase